MDTKTLRDDATGIPELGVTEPWQSLFLLPAEYVDLSTLITSFSDIHPQSTHALVKAELVSIQGYMVDRASRERTPSNRPFPTMIVMVLSDGVSTIECEAFGVGDWRSAEMNESITLYVAIKSYAERGMYFVAPQIARQQPLPRVDYVGIAGKVSGAVIGQYAQHAIREIANVELASHWVRSERPVLSRIFTKHWKGTIESFFLALHSPKNVRQGREARAFARRASMAEIRYAGRISNRRSVAIAPFESMREKVWAAWQAQKEEPSAGQIAALKAALPGLAGEKPARVLINGDVGSGKTLVFLTITAAFAGDGRPVAIMAPNETLAKQIHHEFITRFPQYTCKYVVGGTEQNTLPATVWIGTSALLFLKEKPEFALVVIDEQHKWSREQREMLLSDQTHLIEVSATPIPRSLAIALFDGCILANIPTGPVNKRIHSRLITKEQRDQVTPLHRAAIESGQRVIYLYAAVKQSKSAKTVQTDTSEIKENLRDANSAFKSMEAAFPDKVAIVHGQMSSEMATRNLDAFRDGTKPILIASTAIEVGLDVPDVRLMVVNDAERHGAAGLHQLRGRVARNGGEAHFVMITKNDLKKDAKERLNAVRDISNGYKLAERDLEIRGFGEVAGDYQTGASTTTFKLTKITATDFL